MSLISAGGYLMFPAWPPWGGLYSQSLTLDSEGDKVAFIFRVPKTGSITKVGFKTGTVTNSQTLKIGLYAVDGATGDPTTDLYGGSGTVTQASPASATAYTVTLSTAASATRGDVVALVIEFNSTGGVVPIFTHQYGINNAMCYGDEYNGSSWTKSTKNPVFWIEYADGTCPPATWYPFITFTVTGFSSSSNPDERGVKFKLPFRCRLWGLRRSSYGTEAGFTLKLYDHLTNLLYSFTPDPDIDMGGTAIEKEIIFERSIILAPNVYYRLTLLPTTTSNANLYDFECASTTVMAGLPGGLDFIQTYRTEAGAWTDVNTKRPHWQLCLDMIEDGKRFSRTFRQLGG